MQTRPCYSNRGSGLLAAVCAIAVLSLLLGSYLITLIPKYRSVHQAASWHDAHQAAEGGVNYAVQALNRFAASGGDPDSYAWDTDWAGNNWTFATADGDHTLDTADLPGFGGRGHARVSSLTVDVYTRDALSSRPWFRVRSSGRSDLPDRYLTADRRDLELRRMKLKTAGAAPDPHVTRTVEAIIRPRSRFSRAISTVQGLTLGNSANWLVDSFDSRDTNKSDLGSSDGGIYPSGAAKQQKNGGLATLQTEPVGTLYGPLISANGAVVQGDVQTVGGDDPSTIAHENVSGSGGMDQTRIFDSFDDELTPFTKPIWTSGVTATPAGKTGFLTTASRLAPKRYVIAGNLGAFAVVPPAIGNGYVEIIVNGNLDIGNGAGAAIVIPPHVYATIYVDGNVDFGNGDVNSAAGNSRVATHLTVYGVSTQANATYSASGNAEQTLSFYGPTYAGSFNGTVDTYGSVVLKSFSISGGGNGGFHYDEALNQAGPVSGWEVGGYFEDARADIK
jgi:hypothetical protein